MVKKSSGALQRSPFSRNSTQGRSRALCPPTKFNAGPLDGRDVSSGSKRKQVIFRLVPKRDKVAKKLFSFNKPHETQGQNMSSDAATSPLT